MSLDFDFSDIVDLLEGDEFDEKPVGIEEFVTSDHYLNLPPLSEYQYQMLKASTQIYKRSTLERLYGENEGYKRWKQTYNEVIFQLGKGCHIGTDEVYDPSTGRWNEISSLVENYSGTVQGLLGTEFSTETFSKGMAEVYLVTTAKGNMVTVSADHRFMTPGGSKILRDLSPGDKIKTVAKTSIENPAPMDEDELKILAYWLGDGMMPTDAPSKKIINMDFSENDVLAMQEYLEIFKRHGDSPVVKKHPHKKMWFVRHPLRVNAWAFSLIDKYSLWGARAYDKVIPKEVFSLPDDQLGIFLGRLWGTDGTVYLKKNGLKRPRGVAEYATVSKSMAYDVKKLLTRFGIVASLRSRRNTYTHNNEKRTGRESYYLSISDSIGFQRFNINVTMLDKQATSDFLVKTHAGAKPQAPYDGDFYWDKIKSIKEVGSEEVFTMTAADTHFFNANLVMNGNSGK